jgi:multiple sugar transport system substrate-binding protein
MVKSNNKNVFWRRTKMSNRKLFTLFMLLALLIPVVLTACGGTGDIEQAVEEAAQQVEEAAPTVQAAVEEAAPTVEAAVEEAMEEPTEEPMEEPTEEPMEEPMAEVDYDTDVYGMIDEIDLSGAQVTFWHRYDSGGRLETMDEICAEFNSTNEYGITVECLPIGHYSILYDNMISALTTGEVPDLIVAYQNQAAAYLIADGLVSIDPYLNDPVYGLSEEEQADFFQSFIDSDRLPQFGNEVYGFPASGRSMEVLYYNKEWLTELGYDAPPQTPEEFVEMTCAAAEQPFSKNQSDFSTGMELSTDASAFASWVFAYGGDIYSLEEGRFTYDTPEALEVTTMLQGMYEDGCIAQIAEQYGDQTDFGNGQNLFNTSSSSGLPYYASAVDDGETGGFEWSVGPFPYTGDEPVQNIYGASTSIVKTDPQTQLASWLFLKFWASTENSARWVQASDYFPARASVAAELSDYMAENEAFGTAFDLLQYGKAEAPIAGYDNVRDLVSEAFSAIVFDGADPASTLADLDAQANQIMEESAP